MNGISAHCDSFVASDADDFHLFSSSFPTPIVGIGIAPDQALAPDVVYTLCIKHNHLQHSFAHLHVDSLNDRALKRLGILLRSNTSLETLFLSGNQRQSVGELWLFVGLQSHPSIRELSVNFIRLEGVGGATKLSILAPFLVDNPVLQSLTLRGCMLGPDGINFVSDRLMERSTYSLEELDLSGNDIGNADLDRLAAALHLNLRMKRLNLANNRIRGKGTASLACLLESDSLHLEELDLSNNSFAVEDACALIDALADNESLVTLNLRNNDRITHEGWSWILHCALQLVCDWSSLWSVASSNHAISSLSFPCHHPLHREQGEALPAPKADDVGIPMRSYFNHALEVADANLLRASLNMNYAEGDVLMRIRWKILFVHLLDYLNIGNAAVPTGALPHILEWLGINWVPSGSPPLLLCAVFRLVRTRPELCCEGAVGLAQVMH